VIRRPICFTMEATESGIQCKTNQFNASAAQAGPLWISIEVHNQVRRPSGPSVEHLSGVKPYFQGNTTTHLTLSVPNEIALISAHLEGRVRTNACQWSFSADGSPRHDSSIASPWPWPLLFVTGIRLWNNVAVATRLIYGLSFSKWVAS